MWHLQPTFQQRFGLNLLEVKQELKMLNLLTYSVWFKKKSLSKIIKICVCVYPGAGGMSLSGEVDFFYRSSIVFIVSSGVMRLVCFVYLLICLYVSPSLLHLSKLLTNSVLYLSLLPPLSSSPHTHTHTHVVLPRGTTIPVSSCWDKSRDWMSVCVCEWGGGSCWEWCVWRSFLQSAAVMFCHQPRCSKKTQQCVCVCTVC